MSEAARETGEELGIADIQTLLELLPHYPRSIQKTVSCFPQKGRRMLPISAAVARRGQ